jgi:hypothetical protein
LLIDTAHRRLADLDRLTPVRQRHHDGIAGALVQLGLHQLMITFFLDPRGGRHQVGGMQLRRKLIHRGSRDLPGDTNGVLAVDCLAAFGLCVGEVGQHVGQPGLRVEDRRGVIDIGRRTEVGPLVGSKRRVQDLVVDHELGVDVRTRHDDLGLALGGRVGRDGEIAVQRLERQPLDLAVHRQPQVHALEVLGALTGLLEQGGGIR